MATSKKYSRCQSTLLVVVAVARMHASFASDLIEGACVVPVRAVGGLHADIAGRLLVFVGSEAGLDGGAVNSPDHTEFSVRLVNIV